VVKKSITLNYETEYQGYFDAGSVMNRVETFYRSHYHPWSMYLSEDDVKSTNAGYFRISYGWTTNSAGYLCLA